MYINMYLSVNNLEGTLPPELALLTSIARFDVGRNQLFGSIPASIYNGWKNSISILDPGVNALTGFIAPEIAVWSKTMTSLHLLDNAFSGALFPTGDAVSKDGIFRLSNLRELVVKENQFTGSIPN